MKVGHGSIPPSAFHGEFTSADASALSEADSRISLFEAGSAAPLTLDTDQYAVITDIVISTLTALTVDVYDGANNAVAAGEKIAHVLLAANSAPVPIHLATPFVCQAGKYPKVKTSGAGQVDVIINGFVAR